MEKLPQIRTNKIDYQINVATFNRDFDLIIVNVGPEKMLAFQKAVTTSPRWQWLPIKKVLSPVPQACEFGVNGRARPGVSTG